MPVGPTELLIILGIVLLLFGGAKLPKLARSLGQAKNEFEAGTREANRGTAATPAEAPTQAPAAEKTD